MKYSLWLVLVLLTTTVTTVLVVVMWEVPKEIGSGPLAPPPSRLRGLVEEKPLLVSVSVAEALSIRKKNLLLNKRGSIPVIKSELNQEIVTAEHGAWILPKQRLPRMRRDESLDAFNDRLVDQIIIELAKAWPPRVALPFSQALTRRTMALNLDNRNKNDNHTKIAFLFLVGTNEIATEPLWQAFFATKYARRRSSIYVHPPPQVTFSEDSFFAPYLLSPFRRIKVSWGSLALVHAEILLLASALADPLNERFVLLSETDVPLWPFPCTYSMLMSTETSFVETKRTLERYEVWRFKPRQKISPLHWRKGSQWFAVTRSDARLIIHQGRLRRWYEAHARRQLERAKVSKMGPWSALRHISDKPNFADEHYIQTTLAKAGVETGSNRSSVLAASLTFATFGKEDEFSVWGDGVSHDFRLDAARWHAVQFGALDYTAMNTFHELCSYTVLSPLDSTDPQADLHRLEKILNQSAVKNMLNGRPAVPDADLLAGKDFFSMRTQRKPRTVVSEYEPDKLSCALNSRDVVTNQKFAPCFLFARKIHSEAIDYYGQLLATYFIEKADPTLSPALAAARRLQRESSRQEISLLLDNSNDTTTEDDYTVRDMHNILAVLGESRLFDSLLESGDDGLVSSASDSDANKPKLSPPYDDSLELKSQLDKSKHYIPEDQLEDFYRAREIDQNKPLPQDSWNPDSPWYQPLEKYGGRVPERKPPPPRKHRRHSHKAKTSVSS